MRRRGVGVALSAALHAAVLGGLIMAARGSGAPPPKPPIVLELLRPPPPPKPRKAPAPRVRGPRVRPAIVRAAPTSAPVAPVPLPTPDLGPPVVARVTPVPSVKGLRDGLRLHVGCDHADFLKLSAEEREACAKALAKASPHDIQKVFVVSDPVKRAAYDNAAAKNDAWSRYRDSTSMDDYPGLHTLLGH